MDRPTHGGRWSRDPETGVLTPGDAAPPLVVPPATPPAAPEPEANPPTDLEPAAAPRPPRKKRI